MGLFDSVTGGGSEEVDHYELKVKSPSGGWTNPDNEFRSFDTELDKIDDLEEKLSKELVQQTAEAEGWPAGEYRLLAKASGGGVLGHEWRFEWDGGEQEEAQEEELTTEERILQTQEELLRELRDGQAGATTDPNEAMGRLFDVAMQRESVGWQQMMEFVERWRGPPTDPNEFAGAMVQSQLEAGNQEAAAALLNNWMSTRGGGGSESLLDLAKESDLGDLDTNAIKTLGMLKFLDDPRSMTRDMASGLMEADAQAGGRGRQSIEDLFAGGGDGEEPADADAEPTETPDEPAPEERGEPGIDPAASAADMDVVGGEPEPEAEPTGDDSGGEQATAEDESGAVVEVGTGTPTDTDADVDAAAVSESDAPGEAAAPDGGETTAEAGTVDDVVEELEEQADAGEPADADEAIRRLSEADADDQDGEEA